MILEFFSINNEWDLLELHLREHSPHVDRFVITESNRNFQQEHKKPKWLENKGAWQEWAHKIDYRFFDATGLEPGWATEQAQREFAFRDLDCDGDTLMMISDVDEMLREQDWMVLETFKRGDKRELLFNVECYYCYANLRLRKKQQAIAVTTRDRFVDPTLHRRPHHQDKSMPHTERAEGGLHFTWFGDRRTFENKIAASIEGHAYSRNSRIGDLWLDKVKGRLFHDRPKLKTSKFEAVDVESNPSFSSTVREFIRLRPDWVLSQGHNQ